MRIKFDGKKEDVILAEECLNIYLGDYTPQQQYAATIILHMLLKDDNFNQLMEMVKEITGFKVNNRNGSRYVMWKKKVKKVGKCEICGSTQNLVAHHKIPWSCSIKGRADISNGQCLCDKCHKMMHDDELWIDYMMRRGKAK